MAASPAATHCAPRRQWPISEKRRIVELTLVSGVSVRAVGLEQGVHPTSLSHWRTLYRAGELEAQAAARVGSSVPATFLPVKIASTVRAVQQKTPRYEARASGGVVELTLPSGASLRLESDELDAAVVCALVAELRR